MRNSAQALPDESVMLVRLEGRLDCGGIDALRQRFDAISVPQGGGLLLDFSEVSFVDSMAMGCVAVLARRVRAAGGEVALFGLSERVRRSFEVAALHRLLDILPDEESARQVLR